MLNLPRRPIIEFEAIRKDPFVGKLPTVRSREVPRVGDIVGLVETHIHKVERVAWDCTTDPERWLVRVVVSIWQTL
jgi:hypothetical protein